MLENDKEQLIGSILDELKELEMLTQGMQDPRMLQELAVKKARNLLAHYEQLRVGDNTQVEIGRPTQTEVVAEDKSAKAMESSLKKDVTEETTETKPSGPTPERHEKAETSDSEPAKVEDVKPQPKSKGTTSMCQETPSEKKDEGEKAQKQKETVGHTNNDRFKTGTSTKPATNIGNAAVKRVDSIFVKSLKSALKLNDRIRYSRELFGGSTELLNSTIEELDQKQNLGEALAYINAQFNWDKDNEAVVEFLSLLERRF
ncbi:MAG: hypothetical protein IKP81_06695 [Paludibacteraceae bacterium]|nr:hypothetical protein [Paludibacteraceae bacterium]